MTTANVKWNKKSYIIYYGKGRDELCNELYKEIYGPTDRGVIEFSKIPTNKVGETPTKKTNN